MVAVFLEYAPSFCPSREIDKFILNVCFSLKKEQHELTISQFDSIMEVNMRGIAQAVPFSLNYKVFPITSSSLINFIHIGQLLYCVGEFSCVRRCLLAICGVNVESATLIVRAIRST